MSLHGEWSTSTEPCLCADASQLGTGEGPSVEVVNVHWRGVAQGPCWAGVLGDGRGRDLVAVGAPGGQPRDLPERPGLQIREGLVQLRLLRSRSANADGTVPRSLARGLPRARGAAGHGPAPLGVRGAGSELRARATAGPGGEGGTRRHLAPARPAGGCATRAPSPIAHAGRSGFLPASALTDHGP